MRLDMDKGRNPKVVRTWMTDKIQKAASIPRRTPAALHKPDRRNKT
jgi:hypothetical protein